MGKGLWKHDLLLAAAVTLALIGHREYRDTHELIDAEVTASIERAAYERKTDLTPQDRVALSCPLQDCDATVTAKYHDHQQPCPACYVRKEGR